MPAFDLKKEMPRAFPKLDKKQIAAVAEVAKCKTYHDGDVLFRAGQTDFMFHVIKSGAVEIIDRSSGTPQTILIHEPGEFTGDLANLTGRTSNVDAIAKGETEVYEVCEADLHRIISERPALSDLILQAFITRARVLGNSENFTGLRVIGSKFSPDTFRIRDFLSKNHVLYTFFDFDGAGVYYAATKMEAQTCGGDQVVVVGGGNSAGQAAIFLSGNARKVYLLIRGGDLGKNMSNYLAQRIEQTANIELKTNTEIAAMFGDTHLEAVEMKNNQTGEIRKISVAGVFSFIGAIPRTNWLPPEIETDAKGFIKTGANVADSTQWTLKRPPFFLETSRAGVFAAGDVRSDSVKRVASAVGEGSMAVQFVHEYLKVS